MRDEKWSLIIPLIGGFYYAGKKVFGKEPEDIFSYPPFFNNDNQLLHNLRKKGIEYKYNVIDEKTNKAEKEFNKADYLFILPPCAGLSMLNRKANADNIANDWIYKSLEFSLSHHSPKAIIGENAPNLFTTKGEPVIEVIRNIATKYGYKTFFTKVNTEDHGLPQRRHRTFFYVIKGDIPEMKQIKRNRKTFEEFMSEFEPVESKEYFDNKTEAFNNRLELTYMLDKYGKDFRDKMTHWTVFGHLVQNNLMYEYLEYAKSKENKQQIRAISHVIEKIEGGYGFWDNSAINYSKDAMNAIIARSLLNTIHPVENRMILNSEFLVLMGFPKDFELVDYYRDFNKIAQNVPVNTAADAIIRVLDVEKYMPSNVECLKYNNMNDTIVKIDRINTSKKSIFLL